MIDTATTLRSMTATSGLTAQQGLMGSAIPGMEGDPFAMLLGQLMKGQSSDLALLMNGELEGTRWPEQDSESLNRASAMLAEMLAAGSPATANLLLQSLEAQQNSAASDVPAGGPASLQGLPIQTPSSPEQLLSTLWAGAQAQQNPTAWSATLAATPPEAQAAAFAQTQASALAQAQPRSTSTAQQQFPQVVVPNSSDSPILSVQRTAAKNDPTSAEDLLMGGRSRFGSSVLEAQKLLTQQDTRRTVPQEAVPDIESLQKAVDSGAFTAKTTEAKEPATAETRDLLRQVSTGLTQNLNKQGKEDFVIRLKPEGMGEITVKLTESEGKIALNISASNAQVARLLGQELQTLQQSLRPFHAEVQTITTVQPSNNPDAALYNGMLNDFGRQQQQQQQASQQRQGRASSRSEPEEMTLSALMTTKTGAPQVALDTYI